MTDRTDNFNRANSTTTLGTPSDGGSVWVPAAGTWGISSNQGYKVASDTTWQTVYLESSVSAVEVQLTINAAGVGGGGGIALRLADNSNYILVGWNASPVNTYWIYEVAGGSFTLKASYSGTLSAGDVLKARADSSNVITAYQNGIQRATATFATGSANTKHGLACYGGGGNSNLHDDFSITAIVAADTLMPQACL